MYQSTVGEIAANINRRMTRGEGTRDTCALTLAHLKLGSSDYGPGTPIQVLGTSQSRPGFISVRSLLDSVTGEVASEMVVLR